MNDKLVVVTDLGSFKAYKLEANGLHSLPRLELIEEFNFIEAHAKLSDRLSDFAGRTPGLGNWAAPSGERHNIALERKRRLVKQVAHALTELLGQNGSEACYFAAAKEINHQILAELPRQVRAKIEKNVPCDLTKVEKTEILRHFDIQKVKLSDLPSLQARDQARRSGNYRAQV